VTTPPKDLLVIDADTHFTEPWDLWTSRAPKKYRDVVPHVHPDPETGKAFWFVDGDKKLIRAGGGSVINRAGNKRSFWDEDIMAGLVPDEIHPGSFDAEARIEVMDKQGVWAHIVYPNAIGFAAGRILQLPDKNLAKLIIQIYNDALAEWQASSHGRLFPQALLPFWDIDATVAEVERAVKELKFTGVTMSGEPFNGGLPDLQEKYWDPFYEACTDLGIPINIHIGSGDTPASADPYARKVWPSQDDYRRYVLRCVQLELANSNFLTNFCTSDIATRWPKLKWVSVESGIGWIPYVLERTDYQLLEVLAEDPAMRRPPAMDIFHSNVLACFWFEKSAPAHLLEDVGFDNVMFESDFPHPTCLYPDPVTHALEQMKEHSEENIRKVMGGNAAKLYGISGPPAA
jgi:uncharacterized protein